VNQPSNWVDGNAIAGVLFAVFRVEMTAEAVSCAACATTRRIADLEVFTHAHGVVVRCPSCHASMLVIVSRGEMACVDVSGILMSSAPRGVASDS
jgi:hypothetical protein